jgi:GxxExxY protein
MTKKYIEDLTYSIVGAAIEVHKALGPGLLESVYQKCLKAEFRHRGILYNSEMPVPIHYRGVQMDTELRCDFVVESAIVLELKAIEVVAPVHEAQLLTYMKLLNLPKGILINFHCVNLFKEGQKTLVNELFRNLQEK